MAGAVGLVGGEVAGGKSHVPFWHVHPCAGCGLLHPVAAGPAGDIAGVTFAGGGFHTPNRHTQSGPGGFARH
jgi:hypothetical protein